MGPARAELRSTTSLQPRLAALADVAVAHRYVVLGGTALLLWLLAGHGWYVDDWHFFVQGAKSLTGPSGPSTGLHVYAAHPYLQYGPIALFFAAAVRLVGPDNGWMLGSAICMGLGVLTVWLLERAALATGRTAREIRPAILVGGIFFLKAWCYPAVDAGHPDDVIALTAVAVAVLGVARGRWAVASIAIGCAAAAKPWALLALLLAAAMPGKRLRGLALAVTVAILPWLPFLLADHRTFDVGSVHLPIEPGSSLTWLGAAVHSAPAWPRLAQFLVASCLCVWALRRGRWTLIPIIAFAVRINLDPQITTYYPAGAALGALLWDAFVPTRLPGIRTMLVWLVLLAVPLDVYLLDAALDSATVNSALRLAVLIAPVVAMTSGGGRLLARFRGTSTGPVALSRAAQHDATCEWPVDTPTPCGHHRSTTATAGRSPA
jgi:hypothetical protein